MKIITLIIFIILSTVGVSYAQKCSFSTAPSMNFGNLNPANTTDVIIAFSASIRCVGSPSSAYSITPLFSDDNGSHRIGSQRRMQNSVNATQYLPYDITYPVITVNKNTTTPITITGRVLAIDYQNAWVGSYLDTLTITINP